MLSQHFNESVPASVLHEIDYNGRNVIALGSVDKNLQGGQKEMEFKTSISCEGMETAAKIGDEMLACKEPAGNRFR